MRYLNKGQEMFTRREFLWTLGLGTATALGSKGWSALGKSPGDNRPNFIFILTDDQTYRAIGYNNPAVKTPSLDDLAKSGIIFENAYVASPICVASRASINTSVFPQQHDAVGLNSAGFQESIVNQGRYKTLAQALTSAGYRTGLYGKSHLGDPVKYGFQQGKETNDEEAFQLADVFLEDMSKDEKPFLLWLAPHKPHIPLRPDQKWIDLYDDVPIKVDPNFAESPTDESFYNQGLPGENYYRDSEAKNNYKQLPAGPPRNVEVMTEFMKAYYSVISYMDYQIGNLIYKLKALGLYENTVIIFLSDNGYFLGNHGLGNKITMHEESVRVPMFLHWAKLVNKGLKCDQLLSSLDVYPTLMDMAGLEKPDHLMGKSIMPLLSDASQDFRKYVASECVGVGGKKGEGHRMVRTIRWKYMLSDTNQEALFDEINDPYEMKNLASQEKDVLLQMRNYMREWMDKVGDNHTRPPM